MSGLAGAGVRALVVLAAGLRVPVLSGLVERVTAEPRVEEIVVDATSTTLLRPAGPGPWPALVLMNGATELGRHHPRVRQLALALARAGHLVLVPDVPGLGRGEVADAGVEATVAVALAAASREDARGGRVALLGISVGTTLALLAAEDPRLAGRVSVIAGTTPFTDLTDLIRLATTGVCRAEGALVRYDPGSFLGLSVARSVCAGLLPGPDRDALVADLAAVETDAPDPVACLRLRVRAAAALGGEARAALDLLVNDDPERFDQLYAALPERMRTGIDRLSPLLHAERLQASVELVSPPRDKYFPLAHSLALVRRAPYARLTVLSLLAHSHVRLTPRLLRDLVRLFGFLVRTLRRARFG